MPKNYEIQNDKHNVSFKILHAIIDFWQRSTAMEMVYINHLKSHPIT